MARQSVILDDRAITYAALYLLEQKDKLSESGQNFLSLLLAETEKDSMLRRIFGIVKLSNYFNALQFQVEYLREEKLRKGKYPTFTSPTEPNDYLKEFENDYLYEKLEDVLERLTYYLNLALKVIKKKKVKARVLSFVSRLVSTKAERGEIAELKNALDYAKNNEKQPERAYRINFPTWYHQAITLCINELPAEKAVELFPNQDDWLIAAENGARPRDPRTFHYLINVTVAKGLIGVLTLDAGYMSLEPETFINHLQRWLSHQNIDLDTLKLIMSLAAINARVSGYSYFDSVVTKELERIINSENN